MFDHFLDLNYSMFIKLRISFGIESHLPFSIEFLTCSLCIGPGDTCSQSGHAELGDLTTLQQLGVVEGLVGAHHFQGENGIAFSLFGLIGALM